MIKSLEIVISPEIIHNQILVNDEIIKQSKLNPKEINTIKVLKRSIDARSKQVVYRLKVEIFVGENPPDVKSTINYKEVNFCKRMLIVGAGPAGLFAALKLIELGIKPIIIERGKNVKDRRRDLAALNKFGIINPDSNYCFGEGGAGTYSDGKLYTRSNKRGDVNKILEVLVQHGASEDILIDARPHIGTNKLPQIITAIREKIIEQGGEIHFDTKLLDFQCSFGKFQYAITDKGQIDAEAMILATGHSARDIYHLLYKKNIFIENKPFALGVRIEHPQEIIDQIQYHCELKPKHLPAANYSLVQQVNNRGVFSFCMCPGGIIAPCATDNNEIVVNGWSPSKRNNPFANSGTVVQVNLDDVKGADQNPLKLLEFQSKIEQLAFAKGGGNFVAPAQRMVDFVEGKISNTLPHNSYLPGVNSAELSEILPPFISSSLKKALPLFGNKMKGDKKNIGYYTNEAILVGVESRTSSPIRIPRDKNTFQHPQIKGLFPCAEGAGYAGGIISAAIDGEACAIAACNYLS